MVLGLDKNFEEIVSTRSVLAALLRSCTGFVLVIDGRFMVDRDLQVVALTFLFLVLSWGL